MISRKHVQHESPKNFQLDLFTPDDGPFEYYAVATNVPLSLPALYAFIGGRGAQETTIAELKASSRSTWSPPAGAAEYMLAVLAGGGHSAFAQAFLGVLPSNVGVLPGQELFGHLRLRVGSVADRVQMRQVPEYAPTKFAGHESGDFVFVRKN